MNKNNAKIMKRASTGILLCLLALFAISEGFIQFALKPAPLYWPVPAWSDSTLKCGALKDTFIVSHDSGDSLHAWYLRNDSATNKVAILIHGYSDQALSMGDKAEIYDKQLHCNILMPDLHAHGKSQGDYVQMGWRDRLDVLQWCEVANALFGGNTHQVLHGVSMGAATVMSVSGEELPDYIRCFVEDCGYTSVWDEFTNEIGNQFSLPAFPILDMTNALCSAQLGWSFKEASPISQVAKCNRPMLFIHGGNDDYVKTNMVYQLYNAKSAPKHLHVFAGSEHAVSQTDHPQKYAKEVCHFANKYIDK